MKMTVSVLLAIVMLIAVLCLAFDGYQGHEGQIPLCQNNKSGALRLAPTKDIDPTKNVDYEPYCNTRTETLIWVNIQGIQGAQGPPVQKETTCNLAGIVGNAACQAMIYEVPAGKRLVIEYFSCFAQAPCNTSWGPCRLICSVSTSVDNSRAEHFLPSSNEYGLIGYGGTEIPISVGQQVRLYADVSTEGVIVKAINTFMLASDSPVSFKISGYLVNVP